MSKRVVVLGGGTGGTLVANRLRRALDPTETEVVVVDQDDRHVYQPGLLFVPFGGTRTTRLVRPRGRQLRPGVGYRCSAVEQADLEGRSVHLADGSDLPYDVLVVATGSVLLPTETEGLTGPGWMRDVFTFYTPEGAAALQQALREFAGGRLAVAVVDLPVKCPVAPLEFAFLADAFFRRRGIRDRVELTYVTPLDAAFTKPVAASTLSDLLGEKGIELVTEFNTGSLDHEANRLVSFDEREVRYDLAVVVPLHGGAPWVARTPGLGDPLGFVLTDPHTLQSKARPEVFAIGDATDVPTSKAGSVAHYEGEVVARNVVHYLRDEPLDDAYDGHATCFIETGSGRALLIDFDYDNEPLPGRFPSPFGLPLLAESRLNHLGKLAFEQFYWHVLLPGRSVPGL